MCIRDRGPSVAGLLVDSVGWRALLAIVTVLSVVVIVLAVAVLKNYGCLLYTSRCV